MLKKRWFWSICPVFKTIIQVTAKLLKSKKLFSQYFCKTHKLVEESYPVIPQKKKKSVTMP